MGIKHKNKLNNFFLLAVNIKYLQRVHIQYQKSVALHTCRYKVHKHAAEGYCKVSEPDIHPDIIKYVRLIGQ